MQCISLVKIVADHFTNCCLSSKDKLYELYKIQGCAISVIECLQSASLETNNFRENVATLSATVLLHYHILEQNFCFANRQAWEGLHSFDGIYIPNIVF